MPEPIAAWWARRQFSRGVDVPYPVGAYREAWQSYPMLVRQYHPDLNEGITLSQIPPAAEVWLIWQCEVGHLFVATPGEQRARPGRQRRRSVWCPDCAIGAQPPVIQPVLRPVLERSGKAKKKRARAVCAKTPDVRAGTPFRSECAPAPASAVEAELRLELTRRLHLDLTPNAVRLRQPFFDHLEAWPDILLSELRIAIEYDSTGRHGLEHVGTREKVDRRKDQLLRRSGWEVIRIRTGKLPPLGPHDVSTSGLSRRFYSRLMDELRAVRGPLMVDAYLAE